MKNSIYNVLKLSKYRPLFNPKRVLVIGAGAVGTHLMESLTKMGVSADAVDFDHFTLENAAKHSCLVRTPEDAGRNKAECSSDRVQPLLDEGCTSNGIDTNLCNLGPEAFADYDAVFIAVDNYDAKVLLGELIRQLPESRRPVIIMDGTYDEMAQSVIIDNKEFCLRCLIGEHWMKDSSIRTSCTGPQIRMIDGESAIVRTSNLASAMAAHLSAEQFRGFVTGADGVMNRRLTYTAFPRLELSTDRPMKKKNCPGCAVHPPAEIRWLEGSVLDTTLGDAVSQITEKLGSDDYEISVHRLNFKKVSSTEFIVTDTCRCCGKKIEVMKHSGRTFETDLVCGECKEAGKTMKGCIDEVVLQQNSAFQFAFTPDSDEALKKMTLYDLGFPLGAHIEVIQRNGASSILEDDKVTTTWFAMSEDHEMMHHVKKLK